MMFFPHLRTGLIQLVVVDGTSMTVATLMPVEIWLTMTGQVNGNGEAWKYRQLFLSAQLSLVFCFYGYFLGCYEAGNSSFCDFQEYSYRESYVDSVRGDESIDVSCLPFRLHYTCWINNSLANFLVLYHY